MAHQLTADHYVDMNQGIQTCSKPNGLITFEVYSSNDRTDIDTSELFAVYGYKK
jgi:hypothetical protein